MYYHVLFVLNLILKHISAMSREITVMCLDLFQGMVIPSVVMLNNSQLEILKGTKLTFATVNIVWQHHFECIREACFSSVYLIVRNGFTQQISNSAAWSFVRDILSHIYFSACNIRHVSFRIREKCFKQYIVLYNVNLHLEGNVVTGFVLEVHI